MLMGGPEVQIEGHNVPSLSEKKFRLSEHMKHPTHKGIGLFRRKEQRK